MLDVEAALAEAEAHAGVIPEAAVAPIDCRQRRLLRPGGVGRADRAGRQSAIPLVRQLTRMVARQIATAAGYVHWGATSQDLIDTSLVLRLRTAVPLVLAQLERAASAAAGHARTHIDTVMPGRTLLSQATPITFGLKAAGWLDGSAGTAQSLFNALNECLVLQLGGASGTLAALGDAGPRVADRLGEQLALRVPDLPWHAHRTGWCGSQARSASRAACAARSPAISCSSRRPRSAKRSRHAPPAADRRRCRTSAIRSPRPSLSRPRSGRPVWWRRSSPAMPQEHERSVGGWHAEWTTLPELVELAGGAVRAIADALEGLRVDADRMRADLEITRGFVFQKR